MSYGNSRAGRYVAAVRRDQAGSCHIGKPGHAYRDSLDHIRASREDGAMRKLILILLLGCAACTTQAQHPGHKGAPATVAPTPGAAAPASGDALAGMRALIGDAACTESSQCRTVPVGALACGGPEAYLPYSTSRTDEKALLALGEQYKAARQAGNKSSGMASICRHVSDPGAVCTGGRCQLGGGSASAAAR